VGVWSVGIIDTGVTDEFQATFGASVFEYDFYYGNNDTDGSRTTSHGTTVATAIEFTNVQLERIDLQVTSNTGGEFSSIAISSSLNQLITLDDAGFRIGAYNMSWGGTSSIGLIEDEISNLETRGILGVAASGNSGDHTGFEAVGFPANLPNVIAVGSHDGAGNPSGFSVNDPATIVVLADGENYPTSGVFGTSFATPQVAATVATAQAYSETVLDRRLTYDEAVDVLQLGGAGPRSAVDPADGTTTYFLHTHTGSVDYLFSNYIDPNFSGFEYLASYDDLLAVYGLDAVGARSHLLDFGVWEGRDVTFDGLEYIASHPDLIAVFGLDRSGGAYHYLTAGAAEGRAVSFDAAEYLSANGDLQAAFGADLDAASTHYIQFGFFEGRATASNATGATSTDVKTTPTVTRDAVSEGATDLPASVATTGYVGVGQSVTGTISLYDRDAFETTFTAGETVVIEARGSASGGGSLYDPELYVYDSSGNYVTYNLDSGAGRDAYLVFTPTTTGTLYLEVDGYSEYTGTYTLSVASASSVTPAAGMSASPETDVTLMSLGDDPAGAWVDAAAAGAKDDTAFF
jgi:hypothetical protein